MTLGFTVVKKLLLLFLCVDVVALSVVFYRDDIENTGQEAVSGQGGSTELQTGPLTIQLRDRLFTVFVFPTTRPHPSALILFASGDGGWDGWESAVAGALQASGYTVMGIDSADYAKTSYDLATLQADWGTIAQRGLAAYPDSPPPVIAGGWSMGAAQAIAVGGGPDRPTGLMGLLLISASSRGRYGVTVADRFDVLPTGLGTFAAEDFVTGVNGLRIAQWHGEGDTVDSTAWLADLQTLHREFDYPNGGHFFGGPDPDFLSKLISSVDWILKPPSNL